jgi:hypothetical protein
VTTELAITVAVGVRNVCLSSHWKAKLGIFRSCIWISASFTHLETQKPDQAPVYPCCPEPDQCGNLTSKFMGIKPYADTGRMSNRQKAEFVSDIFCIQSFWEGYDNFFSKNLIHTGRSNLPRNLDSLTGRVSIAVTHKSLTVWSRLLDHQKAERVTYQFYIWDFRSFSQSETQKLRSILPLSCPESEFSSGVDR